MATVGHKCLKCGNTSFKTRTSNAESVRTTKSLLICNRCGSRLHVLSEIYKFETPTYNERPEALSINKPLSQIDPNQQDLPLDS